MFWGSAYLWELSRQPLDATMIVTQITKTLPQCDILPWSATYSTRLWYVPKSPTPSDYGCDAGVVSSCTLRVNLMLRVTFPNPGYLCSEWSCRPRQKVSRGWCAGHPHSICPTYHTSCHSFSTLRWKGNQRNHQPAATRFHNSRLSDAR